tara:strand:- start:323 stop:529 length:207 start_codon:yes stop_codon:yes gene_type:complete
MSSGDSDTERLYSSGDSGYTWDVTQAEQRSYNYEDEKAKKKAAAKEAETVKPVEEQEMSDSSDESPEP